MNASAGAPLVARLLGAGVSGRLRATDLTLKEGSCVVLLGPNGAGKSTALRLLGGLLAPDQGQCLLGATEARSLLPIDRASMIAWLPQRPAVPPGFTTEELVLQARFRFAESAAVARKHALRLLVERGAGHLVGRAVDAISGGELQRVLLATMSAQAAPLLLVDEPANHLDPAAQLETYHLLGKLWVEEGRGLCVVTHDIRLAQLLGPPERIEVVGMRGGQVEVRTTLHDPALAQHLEDLYGVPFVPAGAPGGLGVRLFGHDGP